MGKLNLLAGKILLAGIVFTYPAFAQNMDYGALESLFDEPVTTSATGKPQRVSDVPVTMDIITAEDIRRSGAVSLAEVLRQVNGVGVIQKTETSYDVSVRGYNQHLSQRLLVLVNGREVYLNYFGYTNWALLPIQLEEIRQVEVIKGPNTALFGFNAVNGVVNIVTHNPIHDHESSVGVKVGTGDYRQGHYVQNFDFGPKAGVRISAGATRMEAFDNAPNAIQILSNPVSGQNLRQSPEQSVANFDGLFRTSENSNLRVELSVARSKQSDIIPLGTLDRNDYKFNAIDIGYDYDAGRWGLLKANIYRNYAEYKSLKSTNTAAGKINNEVIVAQLEDTVKISENHTGRLQLEYRGSQVEGTNAASLLPADAVASHDNYSISGMWKWDIHPDLSWTNAVRADYLRLDHNGIFTPTNSAYTADDYDRGVSELSYNSGVVWNVTAKDTLRIMTARGVEIPSLIEYALDLNLFGTTNVLGNPTLSSAIITNYELGWDRDVEAVNGMFRSSVFYQTSKDVKSIAVEAVADDFRYGNLGESKTYGLEMELSGKFKEHYNWGVGYAFQKIDDDLKNGLSGASLVIPKEFEHNAPKHKVNVNLGYKKGPWEADTLVYYISDYDSIARDGASYRLDPVDGYVGVNARVGYTYKENLIFSVSGQQLQSSKTQTSAAPDVDRRLWAGVTYKF